MKRFYVVEQGLMTARGSGDYAVYGKFSNLKDAQRKMREIAKDIKGYTGLPPHGYLDTIITRYENEEDYEFGVGETVDGVSYYYSK